MIRIRFVLFTLAAVTLTAFTTPGRLGAQSGSIRGTVTDSSTRAPLQGALVTVVSTAIRAETNSNGQYGLSAVPPGQTLYPIPQTERDVAPGITQNPRY